MNTFLQQIQDPNFWQQLNPGLSISGSPGQPAEAVTIEPDQVDYLLSHLKQEGYFQLDNLLPEVEIFTLSIAAATLYQAGIPPTFVFVYDECWQILQRLSTVLSTVLGKDYRQLPNFWVWCIDTDREQMGWSPHRDCSSNTIQPDGMPKVVTVWIPLTDALPLNGCMYILPASLDPDYGKPPVTDSPTPLAAMTMPYTQLQNIRALPVAAGSILCWNQAVLHWGGRSSDYAPHPRISFSCEFQRSDVPPFAPFWFDPFQLPTLEQRLALISMQILQYQHMYPLPAELAESAATLQKTIATVFQL